MIQARESGNPYSGAFDVRIPAYTRRQGLATVF